MRLVARGNNGQTQDEVNQRHANVQGNLSRRQSGGVGDGGGHGKHGPKNNVFQHGNAQHEPGKACVQDFEVVEDARDDRDGGHRDRNAHHQQQGDAAGPDAHEPAQRQHRSQRQRDEERQRRAHGSQPANLLSFMPLEERLGFRAGEEHEHQQAEIVEKVERGLLLRSGYIKLEKVRVRRPFSQHERPQNAAGQNFSDHARLPQARKQIAQQVCAGQQNGEKKYEWADGAGRHKFRKPELLSVKMR